MIASQDIREIRGCAIIVKGDEPKQLAHNCLNTLPKQKWGL